MCDWRTAGAAARRLYRHERSIVSRRNRAQESRSETIRVDGVKVSESERRVSSILLHQVVDYPITTYAAKYDSGQAEHEHERVLRVQKHHPAKESISEQE